MRVTEFMALENEIEQGMEHQIEAGFGYGL